MNWLVILLSRVVPCLFGAIVVCGLIGNTMVVVVILVNRVLRDVTNILIVNLAVADLFFLLTCVPFTAIEYSLRTWPFGTVMCKITHYFQHVSAFGSVWTLVLLAVDRFVAVVLPIKSLTWRTLQSPIIGCFVVWAISFAINAPLLFDLDVSTVGDNGSVQVCAVAEIAKQNATKARARAFYWGFIAGAYLAPLFITSVLYSWLLYNLWHGQYKSSTRKASVMSSESSNPRRKVTKMILAVTLTFAFCWLPQNMVFAYKGLVYPESPNSLENLFTQITAQVLAYINSCVNPIIYSFLSENFFRGFQNLTNILMCREPVHVFKRGSTLRGPRQRTRTFKSQSSNNVLHKRNWKVSSSSLAHSSADLRSNSEGKQLLAEAFATIRQSYGKYKIRRMSKQQILTTTTTTLTNRKGLSRQSADCSFQFAYRTSKTKSETDLIHSSPLQPGALQGLVQKNGISMEPLKCYNSPKFGHLASDDGMPMSEGTIYVTGSETMDLEGNEGDGFAINASQVANREQVKFILEHSDSEDYADV